MEWRRERMRCDSEMSTWEGLISRLVHPLGCRDKRGSGVSWNPRKLCCSGYWGVISITAVIKTSTTVALQETKSLYSCWLCRSPGAWSCWWWLELLLRLLDSIVVCFCCCSCHNHATNAAPGSHLQLLAFATAVAAAASRVNEPMFLRLLAFCCCHFQTDVKEGKMAYLFSCLFFLPVSSN